MKHILMMISKNSIFFIIFIFSQNTAIGLLGKPLLKIRLENFFHSSQTGLERSLMSFPSKIAPPSGLTSEKIDALLKSTEADFSGELREGFYELAYLANQLVLAYTPNSICLLNPSDLKKIETAFFEDLGFDLNEIKVSKQSAAKVCLCHFIIKAIHAGHPQLTEVILQIFSELPAEQLFRPTERYIVINYTIALTEQPRSKNAKLFKKIQSKTASLLKKYLQNTTEQLKKEGFIQFHSDLETSGVLMQKSEIDRYNILNKLINLDNVLKNAPHVLPEIKSDGEKLFCIARALIEAIEKLGDITPLRSWKMNQFFEIWLKNYQIPKEAHDWFSHDPFQLVIYALRKSAILGFHRSQHELARLIYYLARPISKDNQTIRNVLIDLTTDQEDGFIFSVALQQFAIVADSCDIDDLASSVLKLRHHFANKESALNLSIQENLDYLTICKKLLLLLDKKDARKENLLYKEATRIAFRKALECLHGPCHIPEISWQIHELGSLLQDPTLGPVDEKKVEEYFIEGINRGEKKCHHGLAKLYKSYPHLNENTSVIAVLIQGSKAQSLECMEQLIEFVYLHDDIDLNLAEQAKASIPLINPKDNLRLAMTCFRLLNSGKLGHIYPIQALDICLKIKNLYPEEIFAAAIRIMMKRSSKSDLKAIEKQIIDNLCHCDLVDSDGNFFFGHKKYKKTMVTIDPKTFKRTPCPFCKNKEKKLLSKQTRS